MSGRAGAGGAGRPLTIAVVVTSLHGGGAEFVGRSWMEWLSARHRVLAVTTSDKQTDAHLPPGVRVVSLGASTGHLAKVRELRRLLRAEGVDVVLGLQTYPNLLVLGAAGTTPHGERPVSIISERNIVTLGVASSGPSHRVKYLLARLLYRRATHVVAISHPVAGELVGGFGVREGRCTVVPNPAASKVGVSSQHVVRAPAGDLDVEVVVANRLVVQKRPLLAVETVAELGRRGLRARLTVFGTGPLLEAVRERSAQRGVDLDLRGWQERWFDSCTDRAVFLLPSLREGFGNVLVEAATAGVPSVAVSSALGVADAVVPGVTGELALDDSPEALADAVQRVAKLTIDPEVLGQWLDRFTLESSGAALEHVIATARGARS